MSPICDRSYEQHLGFSSIGHGDFRTLVENLCIHIVQLPCNDESRYGVAYFPMRSNTSRLLKTGVSLSQVYSKVSIPNETNASRVEDFGTRGMTRMRRGAVFWEAP